MAQIRVRIAPSPTGDPHIGTAYTALFNFAFAKKTGGKFILRIEDTDRTRFVPGAVEAIIRSLKWLGLSWDEGPDIGGPNAPYLQSERLPLYQKYAAQLLEKDWAYYCFCSSQRLEKMREEQKAKREPPKYDGTCRGLKPKDIESKLKGGEPAVIRLKIPKEGETKLTDLVRGEVSFQNALIDDQIILKSDGFPTYHLGVVVDDYLMKISHVIRGEEWLSSTPKHLLLYKAFGWPIPEFAHLPLLRNPDHSKISKRKNPVSLVWYHDQGYLPEALLNFFAMMGFSPPQGKEIFDLGEFIKHFSFERIIKSGPVFNLEKLDWLNGEYIRKKSLGELAEVLKKWADETGFKIRAENDEHLIKILGLVQERMKKLSEFGQLSDFFFITPEADPDLLLAGQEREEVKEQLAASLEALRMTKNWDKVGLEKISRQVAKDLNFEAPRLFMILRVAVTGKTATPPLFETMEILGQETVISRLKKNLTGL
ncbi:MAG: glutamate--tRNA ligase [bacterium]|nr:glutamate--tRNA ligase [bacterium]